ncbi:MAG: Ca-activated chloride channel family protein, partial [Pirellulaceae bacterium]
MMLFALQLEWSHPAALLGLAALWLVWRWSVKEPGPVPGNRSFWRPLRMVQIILLVSAMAGPVLNIISSKKFVVILHDVSHSCASSKDGDEFLSKIPDDENIARVEHVYFDSPDRVQLREKIVSDDFENHQGAHRALAKVLAEMPTGYIPEVVLMSDGRFCYGNALRVAAQDTPIHVVPLRPSSEPDAAIIDLRTPIHAHAFEPFLVETIVASTVAMDAQLRLFRGEELLDEKAVKLEAGTNRFSHRVTKDQRAFTDFRAVISSSDDSTEQNNDRRAIISTSPKLRVLVVDDDREGIQPFANQLSGKGMGVSVISSDNLVASLANPDEIDLVVLSDIPANSYSRAQIDNLHQYVHESGGGLIVLGGNAVFEKARLQGSDIESMLPVSAPIRPGKPRETLAMVLVIDKSGSMLKEDRMRLAKEAAKESVKLLVATDKVGIVAFGDEFEWVSELAPCGDKRDVYAKISGLKAEGRTNMYAAMIRAHLALDQAIADRKHAVILTDGVASPGNFDRLSKEMADAGITVSTISIGKETDKSLLVDIAKTARGRFHVCNDPKEIRDVLVEETLAAVDSERKPVLPQIARQLPGLSIESAPALLGYSPTTPKSDAELLLWATDGDPLLAWWPYGAGRVAAFTSDPKDNWGRDWQSWQGAASFWSRVVSLSRRRTVPNDIQITVARFDNQDHILVDALHADGSFWNDYIELSTIEDSQRETMKFLGPGRFQFQMP